MRYSTPLAATALLLALMPCLAVSATIEVDATGGGDYIAIQDGIDAAAEGDTVLVFPGTYIGDGNRGLQFNGINLSIVGVGGQEATIIDCQQEDRGFNLRHGEDSTSLITGFTIRNGSASSGGGMLCWESAPTLADLKFEQNTAEGGAGGGLYVATQHDLTVTIADLTFIGNQAARGGGLYCQGVSASLSGLSFTLNEASAGGGLYAGFSPTVSLTDAVFSRNSADSGGGVVLERVSEAYLERVTFTENGGAWSGGALELDHVPSAELTHLTLCRNSAVVGGGIRCYYSSPNVHNSILAFSGGGKGISCSSGSNPTLTCCNTYGNAGGDELCGVDGGGNFSADPLFCGEASGDLRLHPESPCLPANNTCGVLIGAEGVGDCAYPDCRVIRVPSEYASISEALSAASSCDTVLVEAGVYLEHDLALPWGTALVGEAGCDSTVIDAQGLGSGVLMGFGPPGARDVLPSRVEGFTIRGAAGSGVTLRNCGGTIAHCVITESTRAGISMSVGESSPATVTDVVVSHNSEGGIACSGYQAVPQFTGVTFFRNASSRGGGLAVSGCSPILDGCTFAGNSATYGGAIHCDRSSPEIRNSILAFSDLGEGIYCRDDSEPVLTCSVIYGNAGGDSLCGIDDGGNISVDPLFCDYALGDLSLCSSSPCLPENNDCETLIGAFGEGVCPCPECDVIAVPSDYATIAEALSVASSCDTVVVQPGTYEEHDIVLPWGVTLRGAGGADATIIDAGGQGAVVLIGYGAPVNRDAPPAVLRGLTITGGSDSGIKIRGCSPVVADCVVRDNASRSGGGLHCLDFASPVVENTLFAGNSATNSGGGMMCESGSSPVLSEVVFHRNVAGDRWGSGGGLYCWNYCSPVLSNCTFSSNSAVSGGGAISLSRNSDASITNSILAFSASGSGIECYESQPTLSCCLIYGNAGGDSLSGVDGGGNLSADPLFCDQLEGDLRPCESSPCIPENNGCGVLIGALGEGACPCPEYDVITVPDQYETIGEALAVAANGDTVLVLPGVYEEHDLHLPWGVTLKSTEGPEVTTIDAERQGSVVLVGHGTPAEREAPPATLDGFTITGGSDSGIKVRGASPVIRRCAIEDNTAGSGGGLHVETQGVPVLEEVVLTDNSADVGGACYCGSGTSVILLRSSVTDNVASSTGGAIHYSSSALPLHVEEVLFRGNRAALNGGAIYCENLYPPGPSRIVRSVFDRNQAGEEGGGIYFEYENNTTMENCTFSRNAAARGGAVYGHNSSVEIANSILCFSDAGEGIACEGEGNHVPVLSCCNIYGNAAGDSLCGIDGGGNIFADPLFCDQVAGDFRIASESPCAPNNNPCSSLIGAGEVGVCSPPECVELRVPADYGTIEEALAAAKSCDTVVVAPGTYRERELLLPWGVKLTSAHGARSTVIDAGGEGTVVRIGHTGEVDRSVPPAELRGFTITGGGDSGVKVQNCAPMISDCVVSRNRGEQGGGLWCGEGADPILTDIVFFGNSALWGGGGAYLASGSAPTITNATFCGNSAPVGGGLSGWGSAPSISSTLVAFSAGGEGVYSGLAGGVFTCCNVYGNAGGDDIPGTNGDNNFSADPLFCDQAGGDLRLCSGSPCLRENSPCDELVGALGAGNCACPDCRELRVPEQFSTIGEALRHASYCDEVLVGPGVYHERELLLPHGVSLIGTDGPAATTIDAQGEGAVLRIGHADERQSEGASQRSAVSGFTITGGADSGIQVEGSHPTISDCRIVDNSGENGGGISSRYSSLTIVSVEIAGNDAVQNGGGLHVLFGDGATLRDVNFSGNSATSGAGLSIMRTSLDATDITFEDNTASGIGGGVCSSDMPSDSISVSGATFVGNSASSGGGVAMSGRGSFFFDDVRFLSNHAENQGGGLTASAHPGAVLRVAGAEFSGNTASQGGGMLLSGTGQLELTDVQLVGNEATSNGGGLSLMYYADPVLSDVSFSQNAAGDYGGGVHGSQAFGGFDEVSFEANTARRGGAVYGDRSSAPEFTNCTFFGNEATQRGGAVACGWDSNITMTNCTASTNDAASGGGIYCEDSSITITRSILAFSQMGEALTCVRSEPTIVRSCVFGNAGGDSLCGDYHENLFADPVFCDLSGGDLTLYASSPCLPENNPWGELIGAQALGCSWAGSHDGEVAVDGVIGPDDDVAEIAFYLTRSERVCVRIYDLAGRRVASVLEQAELPTGYSHRSWDLTSAEGSRVASGTYLCVVEVGSRAIKKKIAVISE